MAGDAGIDQIPTGASEAAPGLVARDARSFMHHAGSAPCLRGVHRAEGVWLEDEAGRLIMDFHGNNTHHLGYGHPRLITAVKAQLDALPFTPRRFTDAPAVELAEKLTSLWPGRPGKVLLATGGSDAIEVALKIARVATGRYKTISFHESFHGNGFGAVSLGGRENDRARIGPLLEGPIHVRPFYRRPGEGGAAPTDDESWARASLAEIEPALQGQEIAALFAEPVRSTPHVPPAWFWPEVRALCDRAGTLLVFDEIPTGLGKTGRMFASEHFGIAPDITVLGKALGGGLLPIAATIARADLDVAADLPLGHYTHQKNPVTARSALTTLEIIEQDGLADRARHLGEWTLARLREITAPYPAVCQVRGIGLLLTVEFAEAGEDGRGRAMIAQAVMERALEGGLNVIASEGRGITLSPPLVITEDELDEALGVLAGTLAQVLGR